MCVCIVCGATRAMRRRLAVCGQHLSSTYRDCYRPLAEAGGPACLGYMRMHIGKQRRYVLRRPRRYAGQIFLSSTRIVRVAAGPGQPTNFEASAKFTSLGYSR